MNFNQLYYLHFAILMPRLLLYSNSGVLSFLLSEKTRSDMAVTRANGILKQQKTFYKFFEVHNSTLPPVK